MEVQVLAFGIAREIFGKPSISIMIQEANVHHLKASLEAQYPQLKSISSYMVAVNDEYATAGTSITERDEIAIIPPVSGG